MRRDAPEDKLVLFAEVREETAEKLTECVVQTFEESSFSVSAAVTRLPSRLVLLPFFSYSAKGLFHFSKVSVRQKLRFIVYSDARCKSVRKILMVLPSFYFNVWMSWPGVDSEAPGQP